MDPISNQLFSYDFDRFVLQKKMIPQSFNNIEPPKFKIKTSKKLKKTKKDIAKEKNPKENQGKLFFS